MGYAKSYWGVSFLLLLAVGCGDGGDGAAKPASGERPPATRSAACTAFQDAACDFGERCGPFTSAECLPGFRTTFCTSDEAAANCVPELESATCGAPVPCAQDVIDKQRAIDICNEYLKRTCDWALRCDSTATREQCDAEFSTRVDCSRALGIAKDHEACFQSLDALACGPFTVPPECERAIAIDG